ncbi:MAG: hypothetical protein ABGY41_23105 [Candidatus Poribacteria bacterium]
MSVRIERIPPDRLPIYATIPTAFTVESMYRIEPVDGGLAGLGMIEERVEPYVKDYGDHAVDGERLTDWPRVWDVTPWASSSQSTRVNL